MSNQENFAGQRIASRSHNDNASAKYSAPSADFKKILSSVANPYCNKCSGTGYIGRFKHISAGRCFMCIPDKALAEAREDFDRNCQSSTGSDEMAELYLAVCCDNELGPAYLSDGMSITADGKIYGEIDSGLPSSNGRQSTGFTTRLPV